MIVSIDILLSLGNPSRLDRKMGTISLSRLFTRPMSRIGSRCAEVLVEVWMLDRERRALQAMDDAALKDMGLSRADVEGELAKPFWRR
jgi:uncharacterized protein YjiS (DUF1127 family)